MNPQPWRFTNNTLSLPPALSLSVCLFLWLCVVCVYFLLYLSFWLCCESCVFCVRIIPVCLLFWFLRMCISTNMRISSSLLIHISTHLSPYSSVCFYVQFICMHCIMLYISTRVFVFFLLFPILIDTCVTVSIDVIYPAHILILWLLLCLHFAICTSTIICSTFQLSPPNKYTLPWHLCVKTHQLNKDITTCKISSNSNPHVKMNNQISTWNITYITTRNKPVIVHVCFVLSIVCLYIFVCECLLLNNNHKTKHTNNTTSKPQSYAQGPLRECHSIQSGASGLPYYCAPLVCVSEVIESRAVCSITNQKPKKKKIDG